MLQGIETMVGLYEVLGDVILAYDGTNGAEPCICYDSRNEATSVTANYTHAGTYLFADTTQGEHYPLYPIDAGGLLIGAGNGASQSTGLCDSHYMLRASTRGSYEWRGLGYLSYAGLAGLWRVYANDALTNANWNIGSRLSATGRGRA